MLLRIFRETTSMLLREFRGRHDNPVAAYSGRQPWMLERVLLGAIVLWPLILVENAGAAWWAYVVGGYGILGVAALLLAWRRIAVPTEAAQREDLFLAGVSDVAACFGGMWRAAFAIAVLALIHTGLAIASYAMFGSQSWGEEFIAVVAMFCGGTFALFLVAARFRLETQAHPARRGWRAVVEIASAIVAGIMAFLALYATLEWVLDWYRSSIANASRNPWLYRVASSLQEEAATVLMVLLLLGAKTAAMAAQWRTYYADIETAPEREEAAVDPPSYLPTALRSLYIVVPVWLLLAIGAALRAHGIKAEEDYPFNPPQNDPALTAFLRCGFSFCSMAGIAIISSAAYVWIARVRGRLPIPARERGLVAAGLVAALPQAIGGAALLWSLSLLRVNREDVIFGLFIGLGLALMVAKFTTMLLFAVAEPRRPCLAAAVFGVLLMGLPAYNTRESWMYNIYLYSSKDWTYIPLFALLLWLACHLAGNSALLHRELRLRRIEDARRQEAG